MKTGSDHFKKAIKELSAKAPANMDWLVKAMNPYFFVTMKNEEVAMARLAHLLDSVDKKRPMTVLDTSEVIVQARLNTPGSVIDTLNGVVGRWASYMEMTGSSVCLPGKDAELEVYRFELERPGDQTKSVPVNTAQMARIVRLAKAEHPELSKPELIKSFTQIWDNNRAYVELSPPDRVGRAVALLTEAKRRYGVHLSVENNENLARGGESRLLFAVGNPPAKGYMAQVLEVLNRLDFGVTRFYALILDTGVHPYLVCTLYGAMRSGKLLRLDTEEFETIKRELFNSQILSPESRIYSPFLASGLFSGEDISLLNAMIAFCHTMLAHNQPDAYDLGSVVRAFSSHPDICQTLTAAFRARFDPDASARRDCESAIERAEERVRALSTGHRRIDEMRTRVFLTALLLVRRTLKTNFFVAEKQSLAFRLDPAYLDDLDPIFTEDLPHVRPFRVTYFFGRYGIGYHVGYSDIARGGWRTIITEARDDFMANANTLFREVCVLAHTQHLKNKDIYEGGSKLVALLYTEGETGARKNQLLYKLQHSFINGFLDVFTTRDGKVADSRVVDYFGDEEPIELGPDENMHDSMVEHIANLSEKRGYVLGRGIMSSKKVGINHKEYGVTSLGVMKFSEIAMSETGIDMRRDPFSVKITGGPNGDVAGNYMRLLLERCPHAEIRLIVDGTGILHDPNGINKDGLSSIVLTCDLDGFDPEKLGVGATLYYRTQRRREGAKDLFRKMVRTPEGLEERWATTDELNRSYDDLLFEVATDLFIPAGGRPETVDGVNWRKMLGTGGVPTCRVIVEGANSFITPEARDRLQEEGVMILRDASANKCGVISSSYEVIANLMMSEREFIARKKEYVADVLDILEEHAEAEARLIFRRYNGGWKGKSYTQISEGLSWEINGHYEKLFKFFRDRPQLWKKPIFRRILLGHMPRLIREDKRFRARLPRLPEKIRSAILAAQLATLIVYSGKWEREPDMEKLLVEFVGRLGEGA